MHLVYRTYSLIFFFYCYETLCVGTTLARQDRYERMLSQGHRSALAPKKTPKDSRSAELRKQIIDMLRNGKKMT
jgi:hypothetical protein